MTADWMTQHCGLQSWPIQGLHSKQAGLSSPTTVIPIKHKDQLPYALHTQEDATHQNGRVSSNHTINMCCWCGMQWPRNQRNAQPGIPATAGRASQEPDSRQHTSPTHLICQPKLPLSLPIIAPPPANPRRPHHPSLSDPPPTSPSNQEHCPLSCSATCSAATAAACSAGPHAG